ncbi:MAG TPA: hypothetical protein PKU82_09960, partial [Bacteroidia bacterium]|nr:hypothetical protein [Bacteroidia bacterium]HQX68973.1 hypothetical protein [Bacteroidia bacterium]HQZ78208.1 hypothetical protein [Bacteroidia bacterium]
KLPFSNLSAVADYLIFKFSNYQIKPSQLSKLPFSNLSAVADYLIFKLSNYQINTFSNYQIIKSNLPTSMPN